VQIPDVATVREQGYPEMEGEGWNALLTRAGTPPAVIDRLNREVVRILSLPEVQQRLRGVEIKTSDPRPSPAYSRRHDSLDEGDSRVRRETRELDARHRPTHVKEVLPRNFRTQFCALGELTGAPTFSQ